jgi:hypothetical protein
VCIEQRDVPDDDDDDDGGGGGDDSEPENDISGMCDDEGQPEAEDEGGDTSQQADGGEVGKAVAGGPLELQITEWGALVYSDPPTAAMVDSARVPKEFKETVGWQVAVVGEDGAIGDWQDVDGQHGEYLHYDVPPEYAGKQLRFRAYTVDFDWSTVGGSGGGESNGGGGESNGGGGENSGGSE